MNTVKFIDEQVKLIKETVGSEQAVSALSGGVDSATCTVLAHMALEDRLKIIFIDDGLMRQDEGEEVKTAFAGLGVEVDIVDAADEFFAALKGKTDPEEKRKAFRDRFYSTFRDQVLKSGARYLIQGTIKADIIETKGGVKTQHNILEQIGIDPESGYGFKVIEPLKELFKPDVRQVCRELGLPASIHQRMPFPGPGLAARIIGEVSPDRVEIVRKATKIIEDELMQIKPFQAFAVLLNDKGTGVEKGKRKFGNIIIIRSVESENALTASPTMIGWKRLLRLAERITEEIPSVARVAYELTSKPPSTIEYI